MSWTQQVTHVFLKDVRAVRWLLLAYAVLLTIGIAEAVTALSLSTELLPLGSMVFRLLAVVIVTEVMLADSLFSPRAQWASLPYARSAVLAAKCVMIGILLLFTASATVIFLRALDVQMSLMLRPLMRGTLPLAALLSAAALTATVVSSLRAALLVLLCALPALFLIGMVATRLLPNRVGNTSGPAVLLILIGVAGLVGVVHMFRARRATLPTRASVFGSVIILIGLHFATPSVNAAHVRVNAENVTVTAELVQRVGGELRDDKRLVIAPNFSGLTPTQRVQWKPASVQLGIAGAEARTLSSVSLRQILNAPLLPLPSNLAWLGASPRRVVRTLTGDTIGSMLGSANVILRRSETGVAAVINNEIIHNITHVSVRGSMELREPLLLGRLPLSTNARLVRNGRTITVRSFSLPAQPELSVEFERLPGDGWEDLEHYTFLLVNTQRNEVLRLEWFETNYSPGSWLLAPTISGRTYGLLRPETYGLTPGGSQQINMSAIPFDREWLQAAELVVVEWVFAGSIPVAARAAIQ